MRVLIIQNPESKRIDQLLQVSEAPDTQTVLSMRAGLSTLELANHSAGSGVFDIVVMETSLPDSDGFFACSVLRNHEDFGELPVVMVTWEDSQDVLFEQSFEVGADDFVVLRETGANELVARLRRAHKLRAAHTSAASQKKELEASNERLRLMASVDELTGLYNARYLNVVLDAQWRWSVEHGKPLSLIILDLDRFKAINDTYDHLTGNEVLQSVAARIAHSIRQSTDLAARFGGEEFAVLLPGAPLSRALSIAEQLKHKIADHPIRCRESGYVINVTASIGVASVYAGKNDNVHSPAQLLREADRSLYQGKAEGRNRIILSTWSDGITDIVQDENVAVAADGAETEHGASNEPPEISNLRQKPQFSSRELLSPTRTDN